MYRAREARSVFNMSGSLIDSKFTLVWEHLKLCNAGKILKRKRKHKNLLLHVVVQVGNAEEWHKPVPWHKIKEAQHTLGDELW